MRNLMTSPVGQYRSTDGSVIEIYGGIGDESNGAFVLSVSPRRAILCLASSDKGWEHVSASLQTRCPTWDEMKRIKEMFFLPEEVVMQLHPAKSSYVNNNPNVLHLWRPTLMAIPLPPVSFV